MTITCISTRKTYSLGVDGHLQDEWLYLNGKWRTQKTGFRETKWFEDYKYCIVETEDMLECWLGYLPGVVESTVHRDLSITFDMDDVEEAGWDEQRIINILGNMSTHVRMRPVIHGEGPWPTSSTDAYGHCIEYYRYPPIDPLMGMLNESSWELKPLGGRHDT